jgi:HAMP domain-containing protein
MQDWLQQFANPNFMPHGHCYMWRPDILWTHVISDLTIGIAYYLIPTILGILLYKRKETVPYKDLFGLFMAFIFFCGTTHFVAIYVTWYPAYEYQGWLKALTAFTSILTVIVLAPKLKELIRLPGVEVNYQNTLKELEEIKQKNIQMGHIYSVTLDREDRIIELKKEVNALMHELKREPAYEM